ncbi:hypothetical protein D0C36_12795 [Mucilaginibacter conchicola]|uniref:DUF6268 domain-containing protein n=1 Tax=Mucilaginibacter conchicola TaxID=2303333 RepID=A0A372NUL8_9SPHI|nr:DUF6268 family outer membrane beta-barrel protein [Mucilaginibacter conchicola]RFZ92307.1 hypothetical protein D0C36_12795 [Mucilaginibacter conchicola]
MKNLPLTLAALLGSALITHVHAQSPAERRQQMADSIRKVYLTEAAVANPLLRQATFSMDIIPKTDVTTIMNGNKLYDGKIRQERISALFNIPLKKWGKNSLNATVSYLQQNVHLSDLTLTSPDMSFLEGRSVTRQSVGFTASFISADSLFGHQVIYTASISGLTAKAQSIQRISYLGGVIFTIKQTKDVRSAVGILVNIDPFLKVPVAPVYSYWRRYQNGVELNLNLPQQVMLRKPLSQKFYGSFGASLAGTMAFASYNNPSLPADVGYSNVDIKTGPGLEYRIAKKFMIGVNAGLLTPLQSRGFDIRKDASDYFLKNDRANSFYFNFTLSLLPVF